MKHLNITINGKVQGVGFRFSAMEQAYRFGVCGFVKNNGADTILIEAEGSGEMLDAFVSWCRRGSLGARVENVLVEEAPSKHYTSFEILKRNTATG
jgi:acylphosphatase